MTDLMRCPGELDQSYGEKGICNLQIDGYLNAMAEGRNGYQHFVYVAGTTRLRPGESKKYFLARLTEGGKLDASFGGGVITGEFSPGFDSQVFSVAVQKNGKIVISGDFDYRSAALARFNMDGSLDDDFGENGVKILDPSKDHEVGKEVFVPESSVRSSGAFGQSNMALLADGKILLVHTNRMGNRHQLIRLKANGDLDLSFQGKGFIDITAPEPWRMMRVTGLGIQETRGSEKLVVSGYCTKVAEDGQEKISAGIFARYDMSGFKDESFKGKGFFVLEHIKELEVLGVTILPTGKIYGFGRTPPPHLGGGTLSDAVIVRLGEDGSPEIYKVIAKQNELEFYSGAVQKKDNKIVVAGTWYSPRGELGVVGRYHENGTPDVEFGHESSLDGITWFPDVGYGRCARVQEDGLILVSGAVNYQGHSSAAVLRYMS